MSDFGLAKLLGPESTFVTTRVMGTFGFVLHHVLSFLWLFLILLLIDSRLKVPLLLLRALIMDYSLLLSNNHDEFVMCILHCLHRYVSPEYASTGMLNEASDIYSFGVLLMEIISGRNPVDYGRPVGEVRHNKMDPLIKMAISTFQHMAYQLDCFAGKFGGVVQGDDWEAAR